MKTLRVNQSRVYEEERGVTLVELMAGIVVTLVVVAAGFTALNTTNKAARANDQTVDTQQNVRVAMEVIARDIKLAGFGMTGQVGACALAGAPQAIVPADNSPGGADAGPDSISLVVPTTSEIAPLWTLANTVGPGFNQITLQAGAVANMVAAGLNPAQPTTAQISINGTVTATVATISGDTLTLSTAIAPPATFLAGTPVYLLQCVTYQVIRPPDNNAVCGGNAPCLVRGITAALNCNVAASPCAPITDGIEDIQFAYACDGCNASVNGGVADGVVDDQNASGTFDQADFITNSSWTLAPLTPDKIRLVQVNVVARQTVADQGLGEGRTAMTATAAPLVISDHNHAADATYDPATYPQFRRRVLTRTVQTRNVGL
jgi:type IV pilus assembly protein PilW